MKDRKKINIALHLFILFFLCFLLCPNIFAQVKPDSSSVKDTSAKINSPVIAIDSSNKNSSPVKKSLSEDKAHSVISMEFVKEKSLQGVDSVFFNVLKISNNNGRAVQGVVTFSVPLGWKIVSDEEKQVVIQPGSSEYIPVRVSLARNAVGGVTYLVNATLSSNRVIFPDKNQTSLSKACYVTVPKKSRWDVFPLEHTIYFNRYTEYTPFKLLLSN